MRWLGLIVLLLIRCSSSTTNPSNTGGQAGASGGAAGSSGASGSGGAAGTNLVDAGEDASVANPLRGRLALGMSHTCAVMSDGKLYCWGSGNKGQLGAGPAIAETPCPTLVDLDGVTKVGAGSQHTCAATAIDLYCWGDDDLGQVGDGPDDAGAPVKNVPKRIDYIQSVTSLSLGATHSCAVSGGLWCWGDNSQYAVGVASPPTVSVPLAIGFPGQQPVEVALGTRFSCASSSVGSLWCWGENLQYQLADPLNQPIKAPKNISAAYGKINEVSQLSAGQRHTCAVRSDSTLWCWGDDTYGVLGRGKVGGTYFEPESIDVLGKEVAQVAAGGDHTCALKHNGTVWCWGKNEDGQIGTGEFGDSSVETAVTSPVEVLGLEPAVEIAAGYVHTCARAKSGPIYCWGNNQAGRLGVASGTTRFAAPELVGCSK